MIGLAKSRIAMIAASAAFLMVVVASVGCLAEAVTTQSASPVGNKDGGKVETAVGDLAADAVRSIMRADAAFVAASELKPKDPPFPEGKISSSDIATLVSYPDDPLALMELSGKAIRQALERAVSIYPQPNLGFLQVSGLAFEFDSKKNTGERVTSITIGRSPVDDSRIYMVATTNSMANGALGYWKVWSSDNVRKRSPDLNIVKAIESFFRANPKIDYGKLDRIKF